MIRSTGDEIDTLNCTFTSYISYIVYLLCLLCCNITLRAGVSFWHRCFFQLVGHGYDLLLLIAMKFECKPLIYRDYFKCKTGLVRFARFFPSPVKDAVQTNSA